MKISEASLSLVKAHCGVSGDDSDELLTVYMDAAKRFAADYTGLSPEQLDEFPDITVAWLDMVNEMFTQRLVTATGAQLNEFQRQILDMHAVNLL